MACVFCAIIERQAPARIEYEDDQVVAFQDVHPVAPVHILVVPRRHIETLNDVTPEDVPALGRCLYVARQLARTKGIDERGYRVVLNVRALAGQSVYHVHFHLLGGRPFRWPPG
ncbi:Purine nucleoside phosphoramidase [bacterium HR11]|nr:Purine nucleoside phosphoramidase [bacterium HR11]